MSAASTWSWTDLLSATGGQPAGGRAGAGGLGGVSIDSRSLVAGDVFFAIRGPRFDGHDFVADAAARGASAAVVERDVQAPASLPFVRVADTTLALHDLARHVRRLAALPVVAVTGSTGKTTTKDMTAALLATRGPVLKTEGNLNNRYGVPLTLLRLEAEHAAAVLELGISAAGEMAELTRMAEPDLAVITNVGPAHLEFFGSIEAIAAAKAEILEGLRPDGQAVLNGDDPHLRRLGESWRGRVVWFGRDRRYDVSGENWRGTAAGMRFDLRLGGTTVDTALPLAGPHFLMDFLAAAAAAHALGVPAEAMAAVALTLRPARHRGEVRRLGEGVLLVDDCYNSSPDALEAAVVALGLTGQRRHVAILGDMLELGPAGPALHRAAGERLPGRVDVVLGVGALAGEILQGARKAGGSNLRLEAFPDALAAAAAIPDLVAPGDAVLVKGSRGMRLETVVDALVARFGEPRP